MSDSTNRQLGNFSSKLSSFRTNLKEAVDSNTAMVRTIEKETKDIKQIAIGLLKVLSSTIASLKQSVSIASKTGTPVGPLNEQIKVMEGLLEQLNVHVGTIKGSSETGRRIRSDIEDIKTSLQQQEKILKDNSGNSGNSGNFLQQMFNTTETQLGGKKTTKSKRKTHKNKGKTMRKKSHRKTNK